MDDRPDGSRLPAPAPLGLVVMGVSGSGKSVVAEGLARELGWRFVEGDRLHPPENVARMASGVPLDDAHREGWLDIIGGQIAGNLSLGHNVIAACSSLKRRYRDRLRGWAPGLRFIYLDIDPEAARARVALRKGHFMPASLVDSQFAALEPPSPDEAALMLDATLPISALVSDATRFLRNLAHLV